MVVGAQFQKKGDNYESNVANNSDIFSFCWMHLSSFHDITSENNIATYNIDQPKESNAGSVMFSVRNWGVRYLKFEPRFIQLSPLGTLAPGQEWIATKVFDFDKNKYIVTRNETIGLVEHGSDGIIVNQNGEIADSHPIIINIKRIPIVSIFLELFGRQGKQMNFDKLPDSKLFDQKDSVVVNEGNFQAELIYSGVSNNIISISYREFVKDFARPAFYQEMKYDLNTSNIITFRTIKMKILEANNSKIAFQVLEDGGLPWIPR